MLDTLEKMISVGRKKELAFIECALLAQIVPAFKDLCRKLPNKRIELYLGGMGCNMSISIYNYKNVKVGCILEGLTETHYFPKLNTLFHDLIHCQKLFNSILGNGIYPDMGRILYNPVTRTVEHNDTVIYL
tara:strand:- start:1244 stop:1636 length:393 start_codon:yes stop_codon:yes gene_type:complete